MEMNVINIVGFVACIGMIFATVGMVSYIVRMPVEDSSLSLRAEVDFNITRDEHILFGYQQAQFDVVRSFAVNGFLDLSDGNSTVRLVPLQQVEAVVTECNKRLEACFE